MATPTYTLEYAPGENALVESPTWSTITADDVLSVSISAGRQSETDRTTSPSTMTIRLDNSGRTYDPAINGDLKPSTQVRLTVTHDATDYVLFRGVVNVDGWQQVDYQHPDTSSCVITVLDPLGLIANRTGRYPLFENRLDRLCNDRGLVAAQFYEYRHFPLGDNVAESYYGARTYWDEIAYSAQSQPSYVAYDAPNISTECLPAVVFNATPIRAVHQGSLDGWLGMGVIRSNRGWANRSDTGYDGHTFGFALKLRSLPASDRTMLYGDGPSSTATGVFLDRDGTLRLATVAGAGTEITSSTPLEPGRTYFITWTWDGSAGGSLGVLRLYVNGVEVASTTTYPTTTSGFQGLLGYVGAYVGNPRVDALYNDVWNVQEETFTAAEVSALYDLWIGAKETRTGRAAGLLCDSVGLPNSIDATAGRIGVNEITDTNPNVTTLLQALEATERGRIYYDHRNEEVAMVSWTDLVTATRHTTAQLKLSDDAAEAGTFLRYYDPQVITLQPVSTATVSVGGASLDYTNLDTRDTFGDQPISYSALSAPIVDGFALASTEVYLGRTAGQAVRSIQVAPTSTAEFTSALDLELFDRIELTRRPHNTGTQSTADYIVEGISYSIGAGDTDWRLQLFLARVSDDTVGVWDTMAFAGSGGRLIA